MERLTNRKTKLAKGGPEPSMLDVVHKLAEYEDLEEHGKLLKLPCSVGDTVWDNYFGPPYNYTVTGFSLGKMDDDEEGNIEGLRMHYQNWNGSACCSCAVSKIGEAVFLTKEEAEAALQGNEYSGSSCIGVKGAETAKRKGRMKYICVKEMCIPKCDGDGFKIPNEYGFVTIGSIWEKGDKTSIVGGDVHLESVESKGDFGWVEISAESLEKNFVQIGD